LPQSKIDFVELMFGFTELAFQRSQCCSSQSQPAPRWAKNPTHFLTGWCFALRPINVKSK
jgi:hypothetical protein